jgi:hypothetical protein
MFMRKILVPAGASGRRAVFETALERREPIEVDDDWYVVTEMLVDLERGTWVYLERPDGAEAGDLAASLAAAPPPLRPL